MRISTTARVPLERPQRYGKQLASHLGRKLTAEWDEGTERGLVKFINESGETYAHVDMVAEDGILLFQAQSTEDSVDFVEDVIGRHLVRFAAKEQAVVDWKRSGGEQGTTQGPAQQDPEAKP